MFPLVFKFNQGYHLSAQEETALLSPTLQARPPSWLSKDFRALINYRLLLKQRPEVTGAACYRSGGMRREDSDVY